MLTFSAFSTLCEAYLGIWPNLELFNMLFFFKTQMLDMAPVTCEAAYFYARPMGGFPKLPGKESFKKWQCSFFYAKNLVAGSDNINLLSFVPGAP
jgi:hypothetical protein